MHEENSAAVVAHKITKRFGGVVALNEVDLAIERGSIHALVGENGAGKSTFGRVLAGFISPDSGDMLIDGKPVHFGSPRDALASGITIVGQERTVVPQLSVVDNIFLGRENHVAGVLSQRETRRKYEALCELSGFKLRSDQLVRELRTSEQLQVEILRAYARDSRTLVFDEVTAALTPNESERLFAVLLKLKEQKRTVLYISHFLREVLRLADKVTVLRDGRLVRTSLAADETPHTLVAAMLGRSVDLTFPPKSPQPSDSPVVFSVEGLSRGRTVRNVSLKVHAGEIVGLAGLVGSGRTEIARAIFGADKKESGRVWLENRNIRIASPRDAIRAGIVLVPESRRNQGLVMRLPIRFNVSLPHLRNLSRLTFIRERLERDVVQRLLQRFDVRTSSDVARVESLSGGNQQKVLFGKWLLRTPRLLIADEPTRGVDVGAKHAIYELLVNLAKEGLGILMISSEMEEIMSLAHRVLVVRNGAIVAEFAGDAIRQADIMHAAFGTEDIMDMTAS
jgi:simple sugar transport system ATP-binding protein/ribose transport system ATP-binding protein